MADFEHVVRAFLREHFGEEAARLELAVDDRFHAAVALAYPRMDPERRYDLAFHLSDWRFDAACLLALFMAPERFTPEQVRDALEDFLIHAPNHVAAAAKLAGWPIEDIFELGALDGVED